MSALAERSDDAGVPSVECPFGSTSSKTVECLLDKKISDKLSHHFSHKESNPKITC